MRSESSRSNHLSSDSSSKRGLRKWLSRLITHPSEAESPRRGRLLLETLERRQLLAGDVDLLSTDTTHVQPANDAAQENLSLIVNGEAQGEPAPDLQQFAIDLADAGVIFYGAEWCPACTQQKELFDDGKDNLPFIEVTGPDRQPNSIATAEGITQYPTWEFPDGSRVTGVQTLQTLSDRSNVPIPQSEEPTFEPVGNQTVLFGSPLHIPIDAYDPDGGPQTVTISVEDPSLVEATVISGNRSIRIDMETYGDMVFELFEQRAPTASGRVIELAQQDFYDGIIFHRVIDNFVLQGGDPTGTGTSGSTLGTFDDDFHPDLQHNRGGILSFAKTTDDTNNSQFFITERDTRHLDFNHSIFGLLIEGEDVREAISEHEVGANDRPTIDIRIESVDVFNDNENAVIMLRALDSSGSTNATITVTDEDGNTHSETIAINLAQDTSNSQPFLNDITVPATFAGDAPATLQLTATDVEGDPVVFTAVSNSTNATVDVSQTGLVTVTPDAGFAGAVDVQVGVRSQVINGNDDLQVITFNFESPNVATPTSLTLNAGSDTGSSSTDGITNATTLTFTVEGTTPNATVEIINVNTGANLGVAVATGSSTTITTNSIASSGDGSYSLAARQTVGADTSALSPSAVIVYDSVAPATVSSSAASTGNVGTLYDSDLISVEEGSGLVYAITSAPSGATIDSVTGQISWTPVADQAGDNTFNIELTDVAGNTTQDTFDVSVTGDPLLGFTLEAIDSSGAAVTSFDVGDRFTLNIRSNDLRELPQGLFSAHTDVFFDNAIIRPVAGATIQHGSDFSALTGGQILNGLVDEVGGTSPTAAATNIQTTIVASIEMEAISAGTVNVRTDPPEGDQSENLLFGINGDIPTDRISFGDLTLSIGQAFSLANDELTVNEDAGATTVDVLANDQADTGNSLTVVSVTQPASGGTAAIENGEVVFTPAANFNGTTQFTYRVSDSGGIQSSATVSVTVSAVNDPPTAVADTFTVDQNSSSNSLDLVANDSIAPDAGEQLSVSAVGTSSAGATIAISADGQSVSYTPPSDFSGVDTFTYTLSDGTLTSTASVTVTVESVDDPPTANSDSFSITEDDSEASFDVTANDTTDAENQSFSLDSVQTPSEGGTARLSDDGTQLLYRPAADFFGTETVAYTIRDTGGGVASGTVTFTVAGVNDPPPIANPTIDVNRDSGQTTVLELSDLPNNVDGDSDTLRFDNLGTPTAGGTAEIDATTGSILYTPPSGTFVGQDTVSYSVIDSEGLTQNGTITINVNDFTEREIAVHFGSNLSTYGINDVMLVGTDALGADVEVELAISESGEELVASVLPGDYEIEIPAIPFLQNGEEAQRISVSSAPDDGDTTVSADIGRIKPEFISDSRLAWINVGGVYLGGGCPRRIERDFPGQRIGVKQYRCRSCRRARQ